MKINSKKSIKTLGLGITLITSSLFTTGCTVKTNVSKNIMDYIEIEEENNAHYIADIKSNEGKIDEHQEQATNNINEVTTETTTTTTELTTETTVNATITTLPNTATEITTVTTTFTNYTEPTITTREKILYDDNLIVSKNDIYQYKTVPEDTLLSLSQYYGINLDELKNMNNIPTDSDNFTIGEFLNIPATIIYGTAKAGETMDDLAITYGVNKEYLCKINNIESINYVFDNDTTILVQVLPNYMNYYDNAYGRMNIVFDQFVIAGDKILSPTGWASSSFNLLTYTESRFVGADNDVIWYQFDGGNNLYYTRVASNVKCIDLADNNIPIIYLKDNFSYTTEDLQRDDQSYIFQGYDVHFDSNGNPILTYNNQNYEICGFESQAKKIK